jgi:hypothetical protein
MVKRKNTEKYEITYPKISKKNREDWKRFIKNDKKEGPLYID